MFLFLIFLNKISGQTLQPGPCPSHIPDQPNFNVEKYLGLWFTYMANDHINIPSNSNCVAANYNERDANSITVTGSVYSGLDVIYI